MLREMKKDRFNKSSKWDAVWCPETDFNLPVMLLALAGGCSVPGETLVTWRGGLGDLFCFFHFDDSLIPPALIFN